MPSNVRRFPLQFTTDKDAQREFIASFTAEVERARSMFPQFHSMHEGLAVLQEEVHEVQQLVYSHERGQRGSDKLYTECVQIAAMAFCLWAETRPGADNGTK